jgi:hypothetical protein
MFFALVLSFENLEKTLMFWRTLCWKCQILSSLIENLLNIKTYTVIFGVQQIRHKFKMQKVDKMEEKRQRNSYLSFRVT